MVGVNRLIKNITNLLSVVVCTALVASCQTRNIVDPLSGFVEIASASTEGLQAKAVSAQECLPYQTSPIYRARSNTLTISPQGDWVNRIESAPPDTEIKLLDGIYRLRKHNVLVKDGITIRSVSGLRDSVVIQGLGYEKNGDGFAIVGNEVTIADLSMTDMRDHAISVKPQRGGAVAPHIFNVHLYDIGTQHIKSDVGGTRNGIVACSSIGYTINGAKGDYNGAIDLHGAISWIIRDNTIYNIKGDGSGCNVDIDCATHVSGPAILVWNQSSGTVVERNQILNSYRNIAFGLAMGHEGGVIRDNFIFRQTRGDAGIELQGVTGTLVENNTVLLHGTYRGEIEYRDSKDITIRNNTVSSRPWNRGNNTSVKVYDNTRK